MQCLYQYEWFALESKRYLIDQYKIMQEFALRIGFKASEIMFCRFNQLAIAVNNDVLIKDINTNRQIYCFKVRSFGNRMPFTIILMRIKCYMKKYTEIVFCSLLGLKTVS